MEVVIYKEVVDGLNVMWIGLFVEYRSDVLCFEGYFVEVFILCVCWFILKLCLVLYLIFLVSDGLLFMNFGLVGRIIVLRLVGIEMVIECYFFVYIDGGGFIVYF